MERRRRAALRSTATSPGSLLRGKKPPEIEAVLTKIAAAKGEQIGAVRAATLEGLNQGLRAKRGTLSPRAKEMVLALFESDDPAVRRAALRNLENAGHPIQFGSGKGAYACGRGGSRLARGG